MDLQDILQSRNRQIAECRDSIMSLDNIEDPDARSELKSLLHRKKDLLVELNPENYQYTIKELKNINEKIYVSSNIIRDKITDFWEFINFNPILIRLITEEKKLKFIDIIKFGINHQFITTFIFLLIGGFVFGVYFLDIGYFPSLNKESFIYFLFFLSSIGILYTLLFLFIPFIIEIIFLKIFQIQYIKISSKILLIASPLILAIIPISIDIFIGTIEDKIQIILTSILIFCILFISGNLSSNFINLLKISMYILIIFFLIFLFIFFMIQLYHITQYKVLVGVLIILLIGILLILCFFHEKHIKLILYVIYLISTIFILILISPDIMKQLHFGNYTPDVLILKKEAKTIIPSGFLDSNNTLKKPKVLSNIGDEYYIELKTAPNKTLRLSIPKNLVLSEQNEAKENMSQKTSEQEIIKSFQSILKCFYNSADKIHKME